LPSQWRRAENVVRNNLLSPGDFQSLDVALKKSKQELGRNDGYHKFRTDAAKVNANADRHMYIKFENN